MSKALSLVQTADRALRDEIFPRVNERVQKPPSTIDRDTFWSLAFTAIFDSEQLQECVRDARHTVMSSLKLALEHGLYLGGPMAGAFLVAFWNNKRRRRECQLIPGYKGMEDLAMRSGFVKEIRSGIYYKGDEFHFSNGLELQLAHTPDLMREAYVDEEILATYACLRLRTGGSVATVLPRPRLLEIRNRHAPTNKSGDIVGPWATDFPAMCRKSAIRAVLSDQPKAIEPMVKLLAFEDSGTDPTQLPQAPQAPAVGSAAVRGLIGGVHEHGPDVIEEGPDDDGTDNE